VTSDFCIELVHVLDEETCYVLPERPTDELLLYLHGIVPPTKASPQKTNFETVVANAARRASVAALMPRGRRGLAPKGYAGWWGWPTSGETYTRLAAELVASFAEKRRKLEALTGTRFSRLYVAGSSSGAYFTAALAVNGGIEADAFGALSGGASTARARPEALTPKPFYIGYGSFDTVGPSANALGEQLRRAGWPVKIAVHPVAHGAKEVYLDEAFAFFREAADQRTGTRVEQPTE
jgi:predicted esterase